MNLLPRIPLLLSAAALLLLLSACGASLPRLPAAGELYGQPVTTTVDSPLAKYYLEHYLAGQRRVPDWDARLDQLHNGHAPARPLTVAELTALSRQFSVDTAALFYAKSLMDEPRNRELQASFNQQLEQLQNGGAEDGLDIDRQYRIVFVPGWLYRSKPWTGANMAAPRALLDRFGIEHHLIELLDNGSVEDNARLVADGLRPLLRDGRPLIVVSGSKGGAEVAMALGRLLEPEETRPVKAWLNICGALRGSPLADKWTAWPVAWATEALFRLRGWGGLDGLRSLSVGRSQRRASEIRLPEHVLVVNYVGVPVSGTILDTEFEKRFTYVQLRDYGPNDGLVLIPDEIEPDGLTVAEVGRAHFLSYPDFGLRATALLRAVTRRLNGHAQPRTIHAADGIAP
ncbi:MAG TPA: hypothetical protein VNJ47_00390 [Nevskiales bacterium]|nr:hypothetical protein [Nevskiales bacterium]